MLDWVASLGVGAIAGSLILSIFLLISCWVLFQKANKPGWAVLIPIYNILVLLQIANKPWWWILLFLIPLVNVVLIIWMFNRISLSFKQGAGFTIGILILPIIFIPILAFSKSMTYTKLPD